VDRILIRDLTTRAVIGVRPDERRKLQAVVVNLELDYENKAHATDKLDDALDYKAIKDAVLRYVESSKHELLEALAEGVASTCLANAGVRGVRVVVDKPGALRFARSVAIDIRREAKPK
jgi:FolB domain-containing protein